MNQNIIIQTLLAAIILSLIGIATSYYNNGWPTAIEYFWIFCSHLLITSILGFYILKANHGGYKLAISIFIIYFVIGNFNLLIEAYIFDVTNRSLTLTEIRNGAIAAIIGSPILVLIFNKWKEQLEILTFHKRSQLQWVWRIAAGIFLYIFIYLLAGMILQATYPPLMDFYKDKIPSFDLMIGTQVFRGLIFVAIAIYISKTIKLSLLKKAIFIGLLFSIIGGIAPLLPISEHMPQNIRFVHGIEVGISNTVYGIILAFLVGQKLVFENEYSRQN